MAYRLNIAIIAMLAAGGEAKMSSVITVSTLASFIALLQSLEENFTLAVAMFVIGFIATVSIIVFVVVMHRSVRRSGDGEGPRGEEEQ